MISNTNNNDNYYCYYYFNMERKLAESRQDSILIKRSTKVSNLMYRQASLFSKVSRYSTNPNVVTVRLTSFHRADETYENLPPRHVKMLHNNHTKQVKYRTSLTLVNTLYKYNFR